MGDEDSKLPAKVYFRIGEVASLVGVEPHVLRYWEREFRTIRPKKSARGQRVYSRKDVETLMRVRQLLYSEGFTIAGARRRLQQERAGGGEIMPAEELASLNYAALALPSPSPSASPIGAVASETSTNAASNNAASNNAAAASDVMTTNVMGGAQTRSLDSMRERERERERELERERPVMTMPTVQSSADASPSGVPTLAQHRADGAGPDRAERRVMFSALRELRHEIESFLAELG